ncbi:MAG: hypothetical protein HKL80_12015 [Acidimicrobiales bacterium]|nr:hypothetical protein [Acidimicrobiales bacterium]
MQVGESLKLSSQLDSALRELKLILDSSESPSSYRWALNHIGDIYKLRSNIDEALKNYELCERLALEANDRELIAEVSADLAELHMREAERLSGLDNKLSMHNQDLYKHYLDLETANVNESSSREARARSYRNRAKYARAHGDAEGSIYLYEKALEFQDRGTASHQLLIPYAKALRLVNRSEEAIKQVEAVLNWSHQINALRSEAIARQYKGLLLLERILSISSDPDAADFKDAAHELGLALKLHEEIGFQQGYQETSVDLFELEIQKGNFESGLQFLRESTLFEGHPDIDNQTMFVSVLAQLTTNGEGKRANRIVSRLKVLGIDNVEQQGE